MNFIIEQQAQFAVGIQSLKERQADSQRMIDANSDRIPQLVDVTMSLARHAEETDLRLRRSGEETDRRLREISEEANRRHRQLADSGAHTDRRLDALIDAVDKLTRRNGPERAA
ncbi:MAG: hypothetical protein HYS61_07735 [Acidobacteria bacterium]|nr:hypothetical protein [Acidobacteriota bacterium]